MTPPDRSRGSIQIDLASAYFVTAARVGTWAVISALVFRRLGADAFAMLALVRSTVGLLTYTSLGLAPAMVHALAATTRSTTVEPVLPGDALPAVDACDPVVLMYATPPGVSSPNAVIAATQQHGVYASGERLAYIFAGIGLAVAFLYATATPVLHIVPPEMQNQTVGLAFMLGFGMVLRLLSEAPSSLLQVRGRIAIDNALQALGEITWLLVAATLLLFYRDLIAVGLAFTAGSFFLLLGRASIARETTRGTLEPGNAPDRAIMRRLLVFGVGVVIAQAADFLYAPTDYILINRLIGPATVAVYAPAVQIDAGLLLLVTGLAAVILPRAALAHAADDRAALRRYYLRGTLASFGMLFVASVAVWLASEPLLQLWLGNDMPQTRAILPLLLVHTVVGGSSAVGRSVLLAMGKVKPFTISVVVAGVANVLLSFSFVYFFHLGLRGIIYGTIAAVVGRCGIWMPWYVTRTLHETRHGVVHR